MRRMEQSRKPFISLVFALTQEQIDLSTDGIKVRPDFTFIDPAGDVIIWEHLGMIGREDYRIGWEWKKDWYARNGFTLHENLFTTRDDDMGGLDAQEGKQLAERIMNLI